MAPVRASTVLGTIPLLFGAIWIGWMFQAIFRAPRPVANEVDFGLLEPWLLIVLTIPAVPLVYLGFRLIRERRPSDVRRALSCVGIAVVIVLVPVLQKAFPTLMSKRVWDAASWLIATMIVIPIYLVTLSWLLREKGLPRPRLRSLVGAGMIVAVCLELWRLGMAVSEAYTPLDGDLPTGWGAIAHLALFFAPFLFYKIAVDYFVRTDFRLPPSDTLQNPPSAKV